MKPISKTCKEMLLELAIIKRRIQVAKMVRARKENSFRAQVFDEVECCWIEQV
jgi:hypothetical protein